MRRDIHGDDDPGSATNPTWQRELTARTIRSAVAAALAWVLCLGLAGADEGTTYCSYSASGQLLAEYDTQGQCTREYLYLGGRLLAEYRPQEGTTYYYATDHLSSARVLTDVGGSRVYAAAYGPHGDIQATWEHATEPNPGFSGKQRDDDTGLDYFGARYYDQRQARFVSVDPVRNKGEELVNPQLWNLYVYANNNPVTFVDPDGRTPVAFHVFLRFLGAAQKYVEPVIGMVLDTHYSPTTTIKDYIVSKILGYIWNNTVSEKEPYDFLFGPGGLLEGRRSNGENLHKEVGKLRVMVRAAEETTEYLKDYLDSLTYSMGYMKKEDKLKRVEQLNEVLREYGKAKAAEGKLRGLYEAALNKLPAGGRADFLTRMRNSEWITHGNK